LKAIKTKNLKENKKVKKQKKEYVGENGQKRRSNPILYFYSFTVNTLFDVCDD